MNARVKKRLTVKVSKRTDGQCLMACEGGSSVMLAVLLLETSVISGVPYMMIREQWRDLDDFQQCY